MSTLTLSFAGAGGDALDAQLLDDLRAVRLEELVAGLHRALLARHAPLDEVVGFEHGNKLFLAAKPPRA